MSTTGVSPVKAKGKEHRQDAGATHGRDAHATFSENVIALPDPSLTLGARGHTEVAGLRLRCCGYVPPQARWSMASHTHGDHHEMILVLGGRLRAALPGATLRGAKGDVLFYPQGQAHQESALGDQPLETIFIAWHSPGDSQLPQMEPCAVFDRQGRIEQLLRWMLEIFPPRQPSDQQMLDSLLHCVLYEHSRSLHPEESAMLRKVKAHIRANLSGRLSLAQLAELASLSKFHFLRLFRQATGLSPMQFVRRARVESARTLLLTTPLPLKQIARQTGFANEYHFSRIFHSLTGQTPGALRKK